MAAATTGAGAARVGRDAYAEEGGEMKTEEEIRDMIASFYAEIKAIQKQPAYNTAAREAIESLTQKYMKGIAALEWVLEPSELAVAKGEAK